MILASPRLTLSSSLTNSLNLKSHLGGCCVTLSKRRKGWDRVFAGNLANVHAQLKILASLLRVFAFAVEGAADGSEGLGERKNVARDQQIGILRADRMPVHTIGCNGDFRH